MNGRSPLLDERDPGADRDQLIELLRKKVQEHTAKAEYDPVVEMALIGCNAENDLNIRLGAHKEVAKYVRPQLKQVEVRGSLDSAVTVKHELTDQVLGVIDKLVKRRGDSNTS